MNLDAMKLGKVNIWRLSSGELCTRPGLRRRYTPEAGRDLVASFSIFNAGTGEVWHYVFDVAQEGMRDLRLLILDELFQTFQEFQFRLNVIPRGVSVSLIMDQIMIGSADFSTLWGLVGSGVAYAVKQDSVSGIETIDVPRGIITAWQNRPVSCLGSSMFIGDPTTISGGDMRAFIPDNFNQRPGQIYGVHESASGMLIACTSAGVYGLDSSAAASGVVGADGADWRLLSHHAAFSYDSSALVRGRLYMLSKEGIITADVEDGEETLLNEKAVPRAFGPRIAAPDFRAARIYSGDEGPMVALPSQNALWMSDRRGGISSWWRCGIESTFDVVGYLRDIDGTQMLTTSRGVFSVDGDFDGEEALASPADEQPIGVLFGQVPALMDNNMIEHVRVRAAVGGAGGGNVYAAVRGRSASETPPVDPDGVTVGSSSWGTNRLLSTPLASVQFRFGERSAAPCREPTIEAAVDGCLVCIDDPEVKIAGGAIERPMKAG